jgi:5-methylthioadenosine/S-adenosylhomocysteine deaminase
LGNAATATAQERARIVIAGGTIVTMDPHQRVLDPGWVLVDGRQIAAIGVGDPPADDAATAIDATGMLVLPGLVNAHTHLFQTLIRDAYDALAFEPWLAAIYRAGDRMEEADWGLSATLGAAEGLLGGVTTALEHQFLQGGTARSVAIIDGARAAGLRVALARTSMDLERLAPASALEEPDAAIAALDELVATQRDATAADLVTIFGGANTPGASASVRMAVAMARYARRSGVRLSMHVAEAEPVVRQVRETTGRSGVVDWLDAEDALPARSIAAHAVHLDDTEIATLARRGVAVSHNPVSNLFLGDGIARIPEMLDAGVTVSLGTDGASSNGTQDLWETMKAAVVAQRVRPTATRWLTPQEVVAMATIGGARALGLDALIGSLEPGKRADVVLVRHAHAPHAVGSHTLYGHLSYVARAADVDTVLVDGQVVVQSGRLLTLDAEALSAEAAKRARAIAGDATA